jgi:two-component system chemotaxis response regulator CheY
MRKMIMRTLQKYDINDFIEAGDGIKALELLRDENPDVITLDITMPEMNGLSCLEKIREISDDVEVIIISALSDKETMLKSLELGADYFLTKPLDNEELEEIIQEIRG